MEQVPQLVIQGGALGLFVWYTLRNNQDWRTYLTERNSKLEKALDKLSEAIDRNYGSHDHKRN